MRIMRSPEWTADGLAPQAFYEIKREMDAMGGKIYVAYKNGNWIGSNKNIDVLDETIKWIREQSVY